MTVSIDETHSSASTSPYYSQKLLSVCRTRIGSSDVSSDARKSERMHERVTLYVFASGGRNSSTSHSCKPTCGLWQSCMILNKIVGLSKKYTPQTDTLLPLLSKKHMQLKTMPRLAVRLDGRGKCLALFLQSTAVAVSLLSYFLLTFYVIKSLIRTLLT